MKLYSTKILFILLIALTCFSCKQRVVKDGHVSSYEINGTYTDKLVGKLEKHEDLKLLSYSEEAGPFIISAHNGKQIMVTGHLEYDATTLKDEYFRDLQRGLKNVNIPEHYFPDDDPNKTPKNRWRSHAHLFFSNWLNYYVYQVTPFDLSQLQSGAGNSSY